MKKLSKSVKKDEMVEVRQRKDRMYDLGCMTANGILICYCGKCKPEDYALPKDFPLQSN